MKKLHVKATFIEPVLGTWPANPNVAREFIASKSPDAATIEDEVAALGPDAVADKGMTVFPRDPDGNPIFYDYQIKGFFKDSSGYSSTAGSSGDCSTAGSSGDCSTAGSSGDCSTAAATGAYCSAKADGKDCIAVVNGACGKAYGALGCYLVLTEYDNDGNMICAKMARVDGSAIRENVYYTLKNGEFVEAES